VAGTGDPVSEDLFNCYFLTLRGWLRLIDSGGAGLMLDTGRVTAGDRYRSKIA